MTRSRDILKARRKWTPEEDELIRAQYPDGDTVALAKQLQCAVELVYRRANFLGVKKSPVFMERQLKRLMSELKKSGKTNRFPKGHAPLNKGLRRPGYVAGRMAETQFKKGRPAHEAANYVPIGTEKYDVKRKSLVRKITDDPSIVPTMRWRPVHVLVWEAANGPIPAGHICIFKPGMKTLVAKDITIDRLEVVSLAENMRRNTIHNYPPALKEVMQLRGRLNRQINKRDKENGKQH